MEPRRFRIKGDDGVVISYLVFTGKEPSVVILHGLAGSGGEFIPTAQALGGRHVILVDQRGHGQSTRSPGDTSREAYVRDAMLVIEQAASGPVDLVGQSLGAHTAMLVAAGHPHVVRRLVLLETDEGGNSGEDPIALRDFFRSWEVPFATRETAREALGDTPLAAAWAADLEEREDGFHPRFDPEVMASAITHVSTPRRAEWESIAAPTLVVFADGGMLSEDRKRAFVANRPNAYRVDLRGASHDAHLDAFGQWVAAVHEFLSAP